MSIPFFRPLDRYVFREFLRVFLVTALGFPLLIIVLDLAEKVDTYMSRNLPRLDIALSYVYWIPDAMFMVLPAAVLFATVFTIGGLTRHSELTAAKASGISFYRVIAPILFGAVVATFAGLALGELVPIGNQKRAQLLREERYSIGNDRVKFAYHSVDGRIYQIEYMTVDPPYATGIQVERLSAVAGVPGYTTAAKSGAFDTGAGAWKLASGVTHVMPDSVTDLMFAFDSALDRGMQERPTELMKRPRTPTDMGYEELGRYIQVLERTGADVNEMRVERMLKIAIPVTCLIIVLFGAPLATSSKRGGAPLGIGISLGVTVLFLLLINLTRAFGGKGVLEPEIAAWLPSIIFGAFGMLMLSRVRT